jgi:phosphoribosylanthranilate isomerase
MVSGRELKICGVTNAEDARLVKAMGADYCGILVDVGFSERSLSVDQARAVAEAAQMRVVLLMCNPEIEFVVDVVHAVQPYGVQLLCQEPSSLVKALKGRLDCAVWKSFHLPAVEGQEAPSAYVEAGIDALLVDRADSSEGFLRMGGTGKTVAWDAAAEIVEAAQVPVFVGGGIGPDNVAEALRKTAAHGIDLCSGVEARKGIKDAAKLRRLVSEFRRAVSWMP